jgi:hypothetical protein
MKQYVVDQLRYGDYEKLKAYLDQNYGEAAMGEIYWIPIDPGLLSQVQCEHDECQPFYVAIGLQTTRLEMEFLVRTKSRIRCNCIAYATEKQRCWMMHLVDAMLEQLEISV